MLAAPCLFVWTLPTQLLRRAEYKNMFIQDGQIKRPKNFEHYLTFDNFPNPLNKFSVVTTFKQPHIFLYQRKAVPMDDFECELFQIW